MTTRVSPSPSKSIVSSSDVGERNDFFARVSSAKYWNLGTPVLGTPTKKRHLNLVDETPVNSPGRDGDDAADASAFPLNLKSPLRPTDLYTYDNLSASASTVSPHESRSMSMAISFPNPLPVSGKWHDNRSLSPVVDETQMECSPPLETECDSQGSQLPSISQLFGELNKGSVGKEKAITQGDNKEEAEESMTPKTRDPKFQSTNDNIQNLDSDTEDGVEMSEGNDDLPSLSQVLLSKKRKRPTNDYDMRDFTNGHSIVEQKHSKNPSQSPQSSGLSSVSPSPPPSDLIPHEGIQVNGRSLRARTAAQQHPYTVEYARYRKKLEKTNWEDAVVSRKLNVHKEKEIVEELLRRGDEGRYEGGRIELPGREGDHDTRELHTSRHHRTLLNEMPKKQGWSEGKGEQKNRSSVDSCLEQPLEFGDVAGQESSSKTRVETGVGPFSSTVKMKRKPKRRLNFSDVDEQRKRKRSSGTTTHNEVLQGESDGSVASIHTEDEERKERRGREVRQKRKERERNGVGRKNVASKRKANNEVEFASVSAKSKSRGEREKKSLGGLSRSESAKYAQISIKRHHDTDSRPSTPFSVYQQDQEVYSESINSDDEEAQVQEEMIPDANFRLSKKSRRELRKLVPAVMAKRMIQDLSLMEKEREEGRLNEEELGLRGSGDEEEHYGHVRVKRGKQIIEDDNDFLADDSVSEEEGSDEGDRVRDWATNIAPGRKRNADDLDHILARRRRRKRKGGPTAKEQAGLNEPPERRELYRRPVHRPLQCLYQGALCVQQDDMRLFNSDDEGPDPLTRSFTLEDLRLTDYASFSIDFQINKIPEHTLLSLDSLVGRGHLEFLLNPQPGILVMDKEKEAEPLPWLDEESQSWNGDTSLDFLMPWVCDQLYYKIEQHLDDAQKTESMDYVQLVEALNKVIAPKLAENNGQDLVFVNNQFDHLYKRLEANCANRPGFAASIVPLLWFRFQLNYRVFTRVCRQTTGDDDLKRLVRLLVKSLFAIGLRQTASCVRDSVLGNVDKDISLDIWVCLINLSLELERGPQEDNVTINGILTPDALSLLVEKQIRRHQPIAPSLIEIESIFFASMLLCQLSQFDRLGMACGSPRMPARWFIFRIVEGVLFPQGNNQPLDDTKYTNSELTARDRYASTITKRYLLFADRWGWALLGQHEILTPMLALFKQRKMQNPRFEKQNIFPGFLQLLMQRQQIILPKYDEKEPTFHTWIKILLHCLWSDTHSDLDKKRIPRLLARLVPATVDGTAFSRPELYASDESSLINHLSLIVAAALVDPGQLNLRVHHAKGVLKFSDCSNSARHIWIRFAMLLVFIAWRENVFLEDVMDIFQEPLDILRQEYITLKRDHEKLEKHAPDVEGPQTTGIERLVKKMDETAVTIALTLRAISYVQNIERQHPGPLFPPLFMLNESRTKKIIDSVGDNITVVKEIVHLITIVLDLRDVALTPPPIVINEESQDDYEFSNLLADTQVLELLSYQVDDEVADLDNQLGDHLQTVVIPSLKEVLVRYFSEDDGEDKFSTMDVITYITTLTACWVRCLNIVVKQGKQAWTPLLRYESGLWYRFKDRLGRLQTASIFINEVLKWDPSQYEKHEAEVLTVWLPAMVLKTWIVQFELTATLLRLLPRSKLYVGHPLDDEELTDVDFFREVAEKLLDYVIESFGRMLDGKPGFEQQVDGVFPKSTIVRWISLMCGAMRDQLQGLHKFPEALAEYKSFCRYRVIQFQRYCRAPAEQDQDFKELQKALNR